MKNRKILAISLSLLLLISLLAGCTKSMDAGVAEDRYYTESAGGVYDEMSKGEVASSSSDIAMTERKLIKTVDINAETEELDELLNALTQQVSQLGGYIENQRIYNGSAYSKYRSRSASMTIRIPAEKLDEFVGHVEGCTNIVSHHSRVDDVTLTYVATESRVNALKVEEERLLELLSKADTMSDLLEVEARLTDVRYELEAVASQLRVLENQVSYSTVNLSIDEVVEYTPVAEKTVWQRISGGFMDSLEGIGEGFVELTVFILANLPYLTLLAGAGVLAFFLGKRAIRKRKAKKENT